MENGAKTEEREGQVSREMAILEKEIVGLQESCSSLEERLSPILRNPIPKEKDEEVKVAQPKVAHAKHIELASTEIADCVYRLRDILDRLEL